jgi:glycosyltransferase involved in cell wall biosynthesis
VKILHVPFGFFPDTAAGTELYVAGLARTQLELGHEPIVAAPAPQDSSYLHGPLRVLRYAVSDSLSLADLWGNGDQAAAERFGRILDAEMPALVHLHAYTSGVSVRCAEQAQARRIPLVFTVHTPVVCARGTLMRWGSAVCDGVMRDDVCPACTVAAQGLPRPVASAYAPLARLAAPVARSQSGGAWTALRLPSLVVERNKAVRRFLGLMKRIIVQADWTRDVLERNDVPASVIKLVRHGLVEQSSPHRTIEKFGTSLRLAYLGRLAPFRGPHFIVEALRAAPGLPIDLTIFGLEQEGAHTEYAQWVKRRAAEDPRIRVMPPIPNDQVVRTLARYDALVVPSQWLETGPLVVLEAFAAGVPVIGTKLGGIAELVRDGIDGLLIEPEPQAWLAMLQRLAHERTLLQRLRAGVEPPRTMRQVANEVDRVYAAALA